MKKLLWTLLLVPVLNFAQIDSLQQKRIDYIKEVNHTYYLQFGNNDIIYYKCSRDCLDVEMYITTKFYEKLLITNKKIKTTTAKELVDSMNYLFLSKGFENLTIYNEGLPPVKKELKLNRVE